MKVLIELERIVGNYAASSGARDALVAALVAAAIEETDAEDAVERLRNSPRRYGKASAVQRLNRARGARRDALSALRARNVLGWSKNGSS